MQFVRPTDVPAVTRSIYTTRGHQTDLPVTSISPEYVALGGFAQDFSPERIAAEIRQSTSRNQAAVTGTRSRPAPASGKWTIEVREALRQLGYPSLSSKSGSPLVTSTLWSSSDASALKAWCKSQRLTPCVIPDLKTLRRMKSALLGFTPPKKPISAPITSSMAQAIGAKLPSAQTTIAKVVVPMAVLATAKPGWPAPASVPSMIVTRPAPAPIEIDRSKADTVIGASIFGGPVTAGDPEVGTLHLSPYQETVAPSAASVPAAALPRPILVPRPASEEPLNKGEGFIDVFGIQHGYPLPKDRRFSIGRGAFNIQAPLSGEADGIGVGLGASMVIGYAVGLATLGLVGYGIYALAKKK